MKNGRLVLGMTLLNLTLFVQAALCGGFQQYPGSQVETALTAKAQKEIAAANLKSKTVAYTSADSYDKVYAFYSKIGKELNVPGTTHNKPLTLQNGRVIQKTYFVFDGAPSLDKSKFWITIQRPMIGEMSYSGGKMQFKDVRETTLVQTIQAQ